MLTVPGIAQLLVLTSISSITLRARARVEWVDSAGLTRSFVTTRIVRAVPHVQLAGFTRVF